MNTQTGFTLIEILVYLALLILLLGGSITSAYALMGANHLATERLDSFLEMQFVFRKIEGLLASGFSVVTPEVGQAHDTLVLADANGSRIDIGIDNGVIRISRNGQSSDLTSPIVRADTLLISRTEAILHMQVQISSQSYERTFTVR